MRPEMVTYEWFAEAYHFTEEMTDSLSADALEWWPVIRMARAKAQETKQAQTARLDQLTQESHGNGQARLPFTQGMRSPGSG